MRIYIGFDDTDTLEANRGTGKLARWFEGSLPDGCQVWGVVRQQLLVHERIPYTSHNSAACVIVEATDPCIRGTLISRAIAHVRQYALEGSDPGVCVACQGDAALSQLIDFGRTCTRRVVGQKDALDAATRVHLSGHGGTNDGIIGAAAAVGLTAYGWSGRFIEFGRLRTFPNTVRVSDLERSNIMIVSVDRDSKVPGPEDLVLTQGWLRPRLWGDRAVVSVIPKDPGVWESPGKRREKAGIVSNT